MPETKDKGVKCTAAVNIPVSALIRGRALENDPKVKDKRFRDKGRVERGVELTLPTDLHKTFKARGWVK